MNMYRASYFNKNFCTHGLTGTFHQPLDRSEDFSDKAKGLLLGRNTFLYVHIQLPTMEHLLSSRMIIGTDWTK